MSETKGKIISLTDLFDDTELSAEDFLLRMYERIKAWRARGESIDKVILITYNNTSDKDLMYGVFTNADKDREVLSILEEVKMAEWSACVIEKAIEEEYLSD